MSSSKKIPGLNPWSKVARHVGILWGTAVGWLFSWDLIDKNNEPDDIKATIIANAIGAIIAIFSVIAHGAYDFIVNHLKRKKKSSKRELLEEEEESSHLLSENDINNPWNARIKAGVVFGEGIGRTFFSLLPIPLAEKPLMLLGGAVGGVVGGIIAACIPWWTPSKTYSEKSQANPASERIRSGAMFGSAIGIVLGAFVLSAMMPFSLPVCLLFSAGLGATFGSLFAYGFDEGEEIEKTRSERPKIVSNPWAKRIRAGIQWGACLGILLGVLLPGFGMGLSLTLSAIVGGALFSVGGGVLSLIAEPIVISLVKQVAGEDYDNKANPWGPRCRFGVALGTSIGMLIGCMVLPGPLGALAGGAIGGLVGGLVAVVADPIYLAWKGYYAKRLNAESHKARKKIDQEYQEHLRCDSGNSYSERCRTGVLIGAALGALLGLVIPIPGSMYAGAALGGILGALITALIPPHLKSLGSNTEEDYKKRDCSDIHDSDIENANDQKLRSTNSLYYQSSLPSSDSLTAKKKAKIPEFNTLYLMEKIFIPGENTQKNKCKGLYIVIGGCFEVKTLQKMKDEQLTQNFNKSLEQNTPKGFSILFHPTFPVVTMIKKFKQNACSKLEGSFESDLYSGCKRSSLPWNRDNFWKTEIAFSSSKHITKKDKTYVTIAIGITASNADNFNLSEIAIQQFKQPENLPTTVKKFF